MPGPRTRRLAYNTYPNLAGNFVAASTQYGTITDNAALSTGDVDFTICAWLWLNALGTTRCPLSKFSTAGATTAEWIIRYNTAITQFQFSVVASAAQTDRAASNFGTPAINTWNFLVAWHDSVNDTLNIQVNDGTANQTAGYTTGMNDSTADFRIGARGNASEYWDGRVDSVGVFKTAGGGGGVLTAAQRTFLYKSGIGVAYRDLTPDIKTGLVAWYNLDGTMNDSFGTNHLTNTNAVGFTAGKR